MDQAKHSQIQSALSVGLYWTLVASRSKSSLARLNEEQGMYGSASHNKKDSEDAERAANLIREALMLYCPLDKQD